MKSTAKRITVSILSALLIFVFLLSACSPAVTTQEPEDDSVTLIYSVKGTESGKIEGEAIQKVAAGESGTKVRAVANEGFVFNCWSDGLLSSERTDIAEKDFAVSAIFRALNSPKLIITTDDGNGIYSTSEYEGASISIEGAVSKKDNIKDVPAQVRGRGNSSWETPWWSFSYESKNSYRIKFDEKQQLLSIGDSKKRNWVLYANKFDGSMLRNWTMWRLAQLMGTIGYYTDCTWVDLYINEEYRGVYLLCEQIEVGKDRVEVDDTWDAEARDTGFLVELDFRGSSEGKKDVDWFHISGFAENESNKREWVVKSEHEDPKQFNFVKNYFQKTHDTIMTGNREEIEKLVDIPSFVDMFIIEELSKDCDVGGASMFFSRDKGGKLAFTAPWDFDFGMGVYGNHWQEMEIEYLVTELPSGNPWLVALYAQDWFKDLLIERLANLRPQFEQMLGELKEAGKGLTPAADRNDELWGIYGNNFHVYVSYETSGALNSFEEHYMFLHDFLKDRYDWIEGYLKGEITIEEEEHYGRHSH